MENPFVYQEKLGSSYKTSESIDIFFEAFYQGKKSMEVNKDILDPLEIYSVRLGSRYKFYS